MSFFCVNYTVLCNSEVLFSGLAYDLIETWHDWHILTVENVWQTKTTNSIHVIKLKENEHLRRCCANGTTNIDFSN